MSIATPSLRVLRPTHATPHNSVLRSAIHFLMSKKEQAALLAPSKRAKKVAERQKWAKSVALMKRFERLVNLFWVGFGLSFMVLSGAFMLYCMLSPAGWPIPAPGETASPRVAHELELISTPRVHVEELKQDIEAVHVVARRSAQGAHELGLERTGVQLFS
jgi:hypothetical protein